MKVKTNELIGPALDWAVAKCEGFKYELYEHNRKKWKNGLYRPQHWQPSTDWAQGGPIIERSSTHIWTSRKDAAYAGHPDSYWVAEMTEIGDIWWGPTPLIAAMRCIVAGKLGDTVDIPKELT